MDYSDFEKVKIDSAGDIIVTSLVDDAVYIQGSQTLEDPPEYAAALCELRITRDEVLDYLHDNNITAFDTNFLSPEILKEVVLSFVEWKDQWKVADN